MSGAGVPLFISTKVNLVCTQVLLLYLVTVLLLHIHLLMFHWQTFFIKIDLGLCLKGYILQEECILFSFCLITRGGKKPYSSWENKYSECWGMFGFRIQDKKNLRRGKNIQKAKLTFEGVVVISPFFSLKRKTIFWGLLDCAQFSKWDAECACYKLFVTPSWISL